MASSAAPKVMISKDDLAASYGKSAEGYESMLNEEVQSKKELYDKIVDMLLRGMGDLEGPVADVSCGPGHVLQMLKERQSRPLIGSDLCQEMVNLAAKRLPDAKIQCADMTDLSGILKDAELAGMVNMFALHHVDEAGVKATLKEAARTLRGGGCLLLAFWEGENGAQMPSAPEEWGASHFWSMAGVAKLADALGLDVASEYQQMETEFDMNMGFQCLKKRT